jgi:hypothetical protein
MEANTNPAAPALPAPGSPDFAAAAKAAIADLWAGVLARHYAGEFPVDRVFVEVAEAYHAQTGASLDECAKFTNATSAMLGLDSRVFVR